MSATDKPFIFISCGQYHPLEKSLGFKIKAIIEQLTSFEGYFAEDQNSFNLRTPSDTRDGCRCGELE